MANDEKFCPRCFEKFGEELDKCPDCEIRLVAAPDKDLTGKILDDRYEVISILGKGGMGVVYRAKQKIIDRPVALKVLRRELIQDESSVKRFLVEAKASSALRSPHTITLFDFGITQEGLLYFTMELLDGTVLTKAILEEAPFSPERAGRIILQACESLKEAHAAGILHRDLKPDNIFLIPGPDGKEHVKVLDFGIAKILDDGASESITKTGMVCGTPMYLSPEQAVGKILDARSDAYSLGIILYEMLAGEPPFVDATPVGVLMKQVNEAPAPISLRKPGVEIPAALERFLMRILAKDPDDRPEDITAMAMQLKAVLEGKDDVKVPMPGMMATQSGVQIPTAEFYAQQEGAGLTAPLMEDMQGAGRGGESSKTQPSQVEAIAPGKSRRGLFASMAVVAVVAIVAVVLVVLFPPNKGEESASGKGATESESEAAADVVHVEEAKPAGVSAESAAAEAALLAGQEAADKARKEADKRAFELAQREKLLKEKEEQLAKAVELADREKALAERETAAKDAEAAAKAAAAAQAESAAKARAEEEAAELAAAQAAQEAKSEQISKSGDANAAQKRAAEARKRADRAKADRRKADAKKLAAEKARKKAAADRKKAEAEKKKDDNNDEPDFEDI
jgi:tRNA A-37 threonylcarbamoyl transferase component Bud32